MANIGFDSISCGKITHGGGTDDHIVLQFFVDTDEKTPTATWPRNMDRIVFTEDLSLKVNFCFKFTTSLKVKLINYHLNNKSFPEELGSWTFNPDQSGSGYVKFNDHNSDYELSYKFLGIEVAHVNLLGIRCIKPATSIDDGVVNSVLGAVSDVASGFADALKNVPDPRAMAGAGALDAAAALLTKIPDIHNAIAKAGNYNDQLFIVLGSNTGVNQRIYPKTADSIGMNSGFGESFDYYGYSFPIIGVTEFTFFDKDSSSNDDWLGTITFTDDRLPCIDEVIVVGPESEGSIYMLAYEIWYKTL